MYIFQGWTGPVALWSPDSEHKRNFNAKGWLKNTSKLNLQPWASKESIVPELIQPEKYMNTFSFIRWPRSRLHGHFYSAPTLEFTHAFESPMGEQRLQWWSLSGGRLYLSFQRDIPLHPSNCIPMDRVQKEKSSVLHRKTWSVQCTLMCFDAGSDMSLWAVVFLLVILSWPSRSSIMYRSLYLKKPWKSNQKEVVGLSTAGSAPLTGTSLICVQKEGVKRKGWMSV